MAKINVGDRVTLNPTSKWASKSDPTNLVGIEGTLTKIDIGMHLPLQVRWDNGRDNGYAESDLIKQNTMTTKQQLVQQAADKLTQSNSTTTTLDIKTKLIAEEPDYFWTQKFVSESVNDLVISGDLQVVDDNGTFRTYAGKSYVAAPTLITAVALVQAPTGVATPAQTSVPKTASKPQKVSMSKAADLLASAAGQFVTATFLKKDQTKRVINGQVMKDQGTDSKLGYVRIKEAKLLKKDPTHAIKRINIQTLESLSMKGTVYNVK